MACWVLHAYTRCLIPRVSFSILGFDHLMFGRVVGFRCTSIKYRHIPTWHLANISLSHICLSPNQVEVCQRLDLRCMSINMLIFEPGIQLIYHFFGSVFYPSKWKFIHFWFFVARLEYIIIFLKLGPGLYHRQLPTSPSHRF